MYPIFQASSKQTNRSTDSATLSARDQAMRRLRCSLSLPVRIMKNSAEPRLARMARNPKATSIFMKAIIR